METEGTSYSRHGMREGHPGDINADENGKSHPAKVISETEHLNINQSQLGRDQGQTPADEHIDHNFSQIDDDSANKYNSTSMDQTIAKEFDTSDFKRVDERDNLDSTEEWDAEKSRTGRHK